MGIDDVMFWSFVGNIIFISSIVSGQIIHPTKNDGGGKNGAIQDAKTLAAWGMFQNAELRMQNENRSQTTDPTPNEELTAD